MKKLIILSVVVGIVGFLWWSFKPELEIIPLDGSNDDLGGASFEVNKNVITIVDDATAIKEIIYQNNIFSPATVNIGIGEKIKFINRYTAPIRISSDPHPVHTSFSEFDSGNLKSGESYEFIFSKSMTLEYHNHFNSSATGRVIVR